jgi:hypothetical protein
MDVLCQEAFDYIRYNYKTIHPSREAIQKAIQPYDEFMVALVPPRLPFAKYIHRERILYDLFMKDEILVFRYDAHDDDSVSLYSNNTYDDESDEALSFVNGVRIMDETDFREQLTANEFTGGYWDPELHWVLVLKDLEPKTLD